MVVTGSPDELKRELRGDAIQVEIEATAESNGARAAPARPTASTARRGRPHCSGHLDDGARAVPGLLAAPRLHGVGVSLVTVARPCSTTLYLRHGGRYFGAADTDTEEATR